MSAEIALAGAREFLQKETLSNFLSEHHNVLSMLSTNATVGDAMKLLSQRKIQSAPIIDKNGEYRGAVSGPDVLRGLIKNLDANLGEAYLENLSTVSAEELTNLGKFFSSKPVTSVLHDADLWMKGNESTNLMTVIQEGYQIQHARVHHRIFVCDPAKSKYKLVGGDGPTVINIPPGSEEEAASSWIPTNVVSQHDIVGLLTEKQGLAQISENVEQLGLGRTIVSTVSADTPTLVAFHHMAMDHKSAIGVTDASGKLVSSLSVNDLLDLPTDNFGLLLQPVSATIQQVFKGARLDTVTSSISFADLVKKVHSERLHRVYIVDAENKPVSIITLTDILRCVSGCSLPKARRSIDLQQEWDEKRQLELIRENAMKGEDE